MATPTPDPHDLLPTPLLEGASRVLHDWWQSKRGDRAMPARGELDPAELKTILPSLLVIGVGRDASSADLTFACRLAGTEIDSRFGIPLRGLTLDELPFGDARDAIRRQYETVVREQRPVFCSHNIVVNGRRYVEYDRMVVPLAGEQDEVSTLVAAIDFRCAYPIERGRPPYCERPEHCDRIALCLASDAGCPPGRG